MAAFKMRKLATGHQRGPVRSVAQSPPLAAGRKHGASAGPARRLSSRARHARVSITAVNHQSANLPSLHDVDGGSQQGGGETPSCRQRHCRSQGFGSRSARRAKRNGCQPRNPARPGSFGTAASPSIHWHKGSWSVIAKVGRLVSRGPLRIAASPRGRGRRSAGHVMGMPRRIGGVHPGRNAERPLPRREGRGAGGDEVIARREKGACHRIPESRDCGQDAWTQTPWIWWQAPFSGYCRCRRERRPAPHPSETIP